MPIFALDDLTPTLPSNGNYWVAPNATLIGQVILGQASSVWFGAALRGDNEPITLGDGSNIQENVVIHTDPDFPVTIGKDCTIGHSAIIHGCTLEDGVLIGMGATILNGAVIGAGSLVGANALVTEGKIFPPNSLIVGAPAKAVRQLDANAIAGLRGAAARYVANSKRFKNGLKLIE